MQFVKHEILPSHGRIIVSQLLPFPRLLPQYEDAIKTANNLLHVEISKTDRIIYWKHRGGFWNPPRELMTGALRKTLFSDDGVHLSDEGQYKYFVSVKNCLSKTVGPMFNQMFDDLSHGQLEELTLAPVNCDL